MNPLISVIVPVYNVEKYLDECIQSIISQTYKDLEVILINDGSTDASGKICDKWTEIDNRIKVLHKKNTGVSDCKNIGLSIAKGHYIHFCDSDDKLNADIYKTMINAAIKNNVDLVMCGFETFPNGNITLPNVQSNKAITPMEFIYSSNTLHSDNDICFTWRLLIKKDLLTKNNLIFDKKIKIGEDFLFNLETIMHAKSLYVISEALYKYRTDNKTSVMKTKYKPYLEKQLELQYEKKKMLSDKYELTTIKSWQDNMAYYYTTTFSGILFRNAMNGPAQDRKDAIKRAIRLPMLHDNFKYCLKNKSFIKSGGKMGLFYLLCYLKADKLVYKLVERFYSK